MSSGVNIARVTSVRTVGVLLVVALLLTVTVFTGCTSFTSAISRQADIVTPRTTASSTAVITRPPLAEPADQSLAISLEMAQLAEKRGMDHEAITSYLEVRQQNPNHPGIAHSLAVLYDRSGRVDDAATEYAKALQEEPDDANLLCDYGYFLYSAGRHDEAEASYRRALKIEPQHRQTSVNLAVLLAHQGNDEEATQLFTQAIGPAAASHNLGMIKLQQGDRESARFLLADAASRDPSVAKKSAAVLAALNEEFSSPLGPAGNSGSVQTAGFAK